MSEWQEYTLGDIVDIKHGYAFRGDFFSETPTIDILVTPGNFKIGGGFKSSKLKYYNGVIPNDYILSCGDIIVTMTDLSKQADTLGYSAKVPNDPEKTFLHNQRIGLLKFKDKSFDKDFIYWLLRAEHYQKFVAGSATGATVKHSSPSRIRAFKFKAPTSNVLRKKIAKILSNYDDLIENNLKRIKLLEESARLTYEEWFLRFRIDGKKLDVDPATNLPFGWEEVKLGDVCELNYGKALVASNRKGGEYPVYGSSGIVGQHDEYICNGKGIILGRKGNVGSVFWSEANFYPIDTCFYITSKISLYFIYFLLKNMSFINNDAAVPGLNRSAAYLMKCTIPEEMLVEHFTKTIKTLFSQIQNYENQNQVLKEARNILLPRLMTGMIDTDDMDVAV